jgi:hypothetical protein
MLKPQGYFQLLECSLDSFECCVDLKVVGLLDERDKEWATGDDDHPSIAGQGCMVNVSIGEWFLHIFLRHLKNT